MNSAGSARTERFIASRLGFKGKMAVWAIAVSFLVMIVAAAVSNGFRKEIRGGISEACGDVLLSGERFSFSTLPPIDSIPGILSVTPVIYRPGIVKSGEDIQGITVKGIPMEGSGSLDVCIPSRLARMMDIGEGDSMLTYFAGEKTKVRRFRVASVYESMVDTDGSLLVFAPIEDLRRLNGWEEDETETVEVRLEDRLRNRRDMTSMAAELGMATSLMAEPSCRRYSQIFDWLDLIDLNVVAILVLMALVAGFNMISGLLIVLFRDTSTIGILKALGMTDRSISGVFLRLSARVVAKGMLIGNALALLFCLVQGSTHVIKLNQENYFVPFVPVSVNPLTIAAADAIVFAVIMALLLIPTLFIAKVDPAQTVKSE